MTNLYTAGLVASLNEKIQKRRELSFPGEIKFKLGDVVNPQDIVGVAEIEGDLLILRVAEELGLTPDEVVSGLVVQDGAEVTKGQVICAHKGLFGLFTSTFKAPQTGKIELLSRATGNIGLRLASRDLSLKAYIGGKVIEVDTGKSILIETEAALVQGIFGVGGEQFGKILLSENAEVESILAKHIPAEVKNSILVFRGKPDIAALKLAQEKGATGMVIGSIDDQTLTDYVGYDIGLALTGDEPISMTLIVTEGFGAMPMSKKVFDVLKKLNGKFASINGATQVRAGALRPEIIVSDISGVLEEKPENLISGLNIGARARIVRVPYFGRTGVIIEVPAEPLVLETGSAARVVKISLDEGNETVVVPRANIEV